MDLGMNHVFWSITVIMYYIDYWKFGFLWHMPFKWHAYDILQTDDISFLNPNIPIRELAGVFSQWINTSKVNRNISIVYW